MRYDFKRKELKIKNVGQPVYRNPIFHKKAGKGGYIGLIILILIIFGLGYLLFYSPVFKITNVEITGTKNILPEYLKEKFVDWQLQQRRFLILKQNNILLFSKKWLRNNIEEKYALDELKIKKKLLHTLKIEIKEKLPFFVWVSNNKYYYVEENGLASAIVGENELIPNLIKVYDEQNKQVKINEKVISAEKVKFITDLHKNIKNNKRFVILKYMLPNLYQFNVVTEEGWEIYFTFNRKPTEQIASLNDALDNMINNKENLEYLEHIDLRIKARVFYK